MHQRQSSAASGHQRHQVLSSDFDPAPQSDELTHFVANIAASTTPSKRADYPLYDPTFEHDSCGTGFVANVSGWREHAIVERALEALANLAHRGAMDADAETSDGVGVMLQLPYDILQAWLIEQSQPAVPAQDLAVGMCFLPRDQQAAGEARATLRMVLDRHGVRLLGWRGVPVDESVLGAAARHSCPCIEQAVIQRPAHVNADAFERMLYLIRKETESRLASSGVNAYIASLSARTVVYKGLLTAATLPQFYRDLADPRFTSGFALFHQRYSTNTFPSWQLAQPMRLLAHNGEINTVQGNRNWMEARETSMLQDVWASEATWLHPVIDPKGSDSTSLDNALELLVRSGHDVMSAMTLLAPEAWENRDDLRLAVRAFFQARAPLMEPWDGPAALVFSDGVIVGAALDRNGLRPLRYIQTADGLLVVASEVGVMNLDEARIVTKGRLGPGQMIVLDTRRGAVLRNREIKTELASRHPYHGWAQHHIVPVEHTAERKDAETERYGAAELVERQALFGYSHEDVELVLRPMVQEGSEAVWSMGDDTPLSVLSVQPRPLATYFKQRFAQVTNPPIDSLREQLVMSLTTYLGPHGNPLANAEPNGLILKLPSPLLDEPELVATLATASRQRLIVQTLSTVYRVAPEIESRSSDHVAALIQALDALEKRAVAAARAGAAILLLSDRTIAAGEAPLPVPLALAAVHRALVQAGLRLRVGLVVETGAAWDAHQLALLIGYGANAVCPYLALATVRSMAGGRGQESITAVEAERRYCMAIEKGLLKILARMGLSVIESYLGAQLFEAIGIDSAVVERYFPGTPTSLGGLTLAGIDSQVRAQRAEADRIAGLHAAAAQGETNEITASRLPKLSDRGYVRFRRNAEYHGANPQVVKALQRVAETGDQDDYRRYAELVYSRPPTAIRDLLTFAPSQAIPLDEVEPAERIVRRFISTAMSLGALSPEAHLTLTLGVNSFGGRSNTGEGGEDPEWHHGTRDGIAMNSRIKQVASGRFGVTTTYLAFADELEIKMAQGSKPGEGGQLPARKVTGLIARLRHTTVGIPLISPPPHHDIYSIEDLAQLIYDLKQVNPRAAVGVKLVSERGVGTVAAGVAKAQADYILISGHDGGTGASPLSSIKNVGSPWELGLAEAQQILRLNGLRGQVRLRTDGGLKTGRDVVTAALLGADEFGFGTAALIAIGCDMARQCHLDTCPTGIATQREDLRRKFTGRPEHVVNFLLAVAREVREILAELGARSLDDVIGQADLLVAAPEHAASDGTSGGTGMLEVAPLLVAATDETPRRHTAPDDAPSDNQQLAEEKLIDDAVPLLERGHGVLLHESIRNRDRAVGARLAGEIARRWGDGGLPHGSITYHFTGSAGQSFGAFCVPGLRLILRGDANDYVGKGMTGGEIIIAPSTRAAYKAHEQVIAGNTILYGATGGLLLVRGQVGERFAVRNSGAVAVVEGVGDHGCEYMTGGAVVVLGATGRNFGAGMSGGVAYVYDEDGRFPSRVNGEMVRLERIAFTDEAKEVEALLTYYGEATGSELAAHLLENWAAASLRFWRVSAQTGGENAQPLAPAIADAGVPADSGIYAFSPRIAVGGR
ncbi:MAG TPA: glutamate synthase large subunit [Ktedonobacterales bacterium]